MNNKEFKTLFSLVAKQNGFDSAFGGWFKESDECIIILDLQKSNYGDYYELNIKIYIQGMLGNVYFMSKSLVKNDTGDVFTRQPDDYRDLFDFDQTIDNSYREERLEKLFIEFITPFTDKVLSKSGIKELSDKGELFLLPAIKNELAQEIIN